MTQVVADIRVGLENTEGNVHFEDLRPGAVQPEIALEVSVPLFPLEVVLAAQSLMLKLLLHHQLVMKVLLMPRLHLVQQAFHCMATNRSKTWRQLLQS